MAVNAASADSQRTAVPTAWGKFDVLDLLKLGAPNLEQYGFQVDLNALIDGVLR